MMPTPQLPNSDRRRPCDSGADGGVLVRRTPATLGRQGTMWRRSIDRPAQLLALVLVGGCIGSLVVIALVTRHDVGRLRRIQRQVEHTNRIQLLALEVQRSLLVRPEPPAPVDPILLRKLQAEVDDLKRSELSSAPLTDDRLARLHRLLKSDAPLDAARLTSALAEIDSVVEAETAAQSALWQRIDADTGLELGTLVVLCIVLPAISILGVVFVRRRILAPLDDLRGLLSRLADGDFQAWDADQSHPALEPLITNFNRLVSRLEELEAEHRSRASLLEDEVRAATEALLEQHATLAHAERLAAVGVTTASLAHELRNPLAGVLMSLGNLRRDTHESDFVERLDLVVAEVERLTRMLNSALADAQHTPEPFSRLRLRELVTSLLALLRYQTPDRVNLVCEIADDLECSLPRDRIRQSLLNLIINSVRAIGGEPGQVIIKAAVNERRLELSVEDDGPGFPPEMLETGIRPFSSRISGGTGLGLAMVRRAALDLGGEVQMMNLEDRGACVRLVVPCPDV
jgi:two-component system, NtrC family, sensor kinase